jgi:hypothetical protein
LRGSIPEKDVKELHVVDLMVLAETLELILQANQFLLLEHSGQVVLWHFIGWSDLSSGRAAKWLRCVKALMFG